MSKSKKLIAVAALLVVLALAVGAWFLTKPQTVDGEKTFTFTIVYKDATSEVIEISSCEEYLAKALAEEGIIVYSEDGYYTTVKGVTADYSVDEGWWAVYVSGETSNYGLNEIPITDGGDYEVRYTIGFVA